MPFEDVDYLKSHSVKESYLFYVDSEKRNKEKFPEPNTYEINFDSPFENVYSLEILDASIPRTQYSIDIHNNQFRYSMDGMNWINVFVPTGDYDSDTILPAINNQLNQDIRINFLSTPSYVKNMFVFTSNFQFYLDFNVENSIKTSLGFNQIPRENDKNDDNSYNKYEIYKTYIFHVTDNSNKFEVSSDGGSNWETITISKNEYNIETLRMQLINKLTSYSINVTINEYYEFVFESFSIFDLNFNVNDSIKNAIKFTEYKDNSDYEKLLSGIDLELYTYFGSHIVNSNDYPYISEQIGYIRDNLNAKYVTINNTPDYGNKIMQEFNVTSTGTVNSLTIFGFDFYDDDRNVTIEISNPIKILYTYSNLLVPKFSNSIVLNDNAMKQINLNNAITYTISIYSNDSFTFQMCNGDKKIIKKYVQIDSSADVTNDSVYSSLTDSNGSLAMQVNVLQRVHTIIAPGVYSLIGDRYVILRCPEIEGHLYRSRSYENYTMGLAKFKLATLGYDDTRIDFSGIPPREFHPIGKLKKLTLLFKRPDNETLYNFRGINHTITFAIRYYSPVQEEKLTSSLLAPSYNPDFMQMLQRDSDSESDSDEN